ncbi:MOSC N-terminal beta barrel domain-containing protein, partial [Thalassolituus sp. UBA1505]
MKITRLYIYPIKSCAAVAVDELTFDEAGPVGDRRFMLV